MTPQALHLLVANGEDMRHQFKHYFHHVDGGVEEPLTSASDFGDTRVIGVGGDETVHSSNCSVIRMLCSRSVSAHERMHRGMPN